MSRVQVEKKEKEAILPKRATMGSAGYDLCSIEDRTLISAGASCIFRTGIAVAILPGYYGQIASRSGLGFKSNVIAFPGVIDSDYRGEIKIKLFNLGKNDVTIDYHDAIAQLLILPCEWSEMVEVEKLNETVRGESGFGPTGK